MACCVSTPLLTGWSGCVTDEYTVLAAPEATVRGHRRAGAFDVYAKNRAANDYFTTPMRVVNPRTGEVDVTLDDFGREVVCYGDKIYASSRMYNETRGQSGLGLTHVFTRHANGSVTLDNTVREGPSGERATGFLAAGPHGFAVGAFSAVTFFDPTGERVLFTAKAPKNPTPIAFYRWPSSIAMAGDYAVVGAKNQQESNPGVAQAFVFKSGSWVAEDFTFVPGGKLAKFGTAVGVTVDGVMLVGNPTVPNPVRGKANTGPGTIHMYQIA